MDDNVLARSHPPVDVHTRRRGTSSLRGCAAIAAATAVACSVSLLPLPMKLPHFGFGTPEFRNPPDASFGESLTANSLLSRVSEFQFDELVRLADALASSSLHLQPEAIAQLVQTYGLRDLVESIEALVTGSQKFNTPYQFGGGGGGGYNGVIDYPSTDLRDMVAYLLRMLPSATVPQMAEFIGALFATLAHSLGTPPGPSSTAAPQYLQISLGGMSLLIEPFALQASVGPAPGLPVMPVSTITTYVPAAGVDMTALSAVAQPAVPNPAPPVPAVAPPTPAPPDPTPEVPNPQAPEAPPLPEEPVPADDPPPADGASHIDPNDDERVPPAGGGEESFDSPPDDTSPTGPPGHDMTGDAEDGHREQPADDVGRTTGDGDSPGGATPQGDSDHTGEA